MKSIIQVVRNHAVVSFFVIAFAVAWTGTVLAAGPTFLRGETAGMTEVILIGLAMLAGPLLASTLVAAIVDGRAGVARLFSGMRVWRVGKWYLTVLVFPILVLLVSLFLSVAVSQHFLPVFLIGNIAMGIVAGFVEELGWMGFSYPRMRDTYGSAKASLYLGLLHGLWHMPAWFLMQYADLGRAWWPYFLAFVAFLVALRTIMGWAYTATNSLLLAQLIHASSTGFLFVLTPEYETPIHWFVFYGVYAACLWLVAVPALRRQRRSSARFRSPDPRFG